MLNLIKYEMRKTWKIKAILLVITAVLQVVFLIGLYGENETALGIGTGFLFMTAIVGVAVIGIYSIILLRNDLNTKQSYMLFMTPNNSYKILGAKAIECGLSVWIIGLFFTALGALDGILVLEKFNELDSLFKIIKAMLADIGEFTTPTLFSYAAAMLASALFSIATAFFAVVLSATLLNGKKYNGFISVFVFFAIQILVGYIFNKLPFDLDMVNVAGGLTTAGFYVIPTVIMFFITAWIMDNKLSV
ncbi:MAG: hypothetical protein K5888_01440 [Lachnospiraceae bacterium]|nr:hypothetical protein [Lachnospiraceae bacterium]